MKQLLIIYWILLAIPKFIFSQNLVPNPSFEDTIPCAVFSGAGPQLRPYFWFRPTGGSSDFFNTSQNCAWGGGVPENVFGYQYPRTGVAYVGLGIWAPFPYINNREYIEGILIDTLKQNHSYCVQFYVSAANYYNYFTDDIGAYFSIDSIADYTNGFFLPYIPQIENTQGNILNDTLNWMLVSGIFTAQGGEKYLTIGNFKDDANTTLVSNPGGSNNFGYYFIDDVSVLDCTVGIEELTNKGILKIKPNPAKDFVEISFTLNYNESGKIFIFNLLGKIVAEYKISDLDNNIYWYPNELNAGIYFARAIIEGSFFIETQKITIIK